MQRRIQEFVLRVHPFGGRHLSPKAESGRGSWEGSTAARGSGERCKLPSGFAAETRPQMHFGRSGKNYVIGIAKDISRACALCGLTARFLSTSIHL